MAQSTTNLGKIHVFPSETLYNQFKDIIADNDLALLKDDGAYIVAALLEQNGYVKFSNGLILQWGLKNSNNSHIVTFPLAFSSAVYSVAIANTVNGEMRYEPYVSNVGKTQFQLSLQGTAFYVYAYWIAVGV